MGVHPQPAPMTSTTTSINHHCPVGGCTPTACTHHQHHHHHHCPVGVHPQPAPMTSTTTPPPSTITALWVGVHPQPAPIINTTTTITAPLPCGCTPTALHPSTHSLHPFTLFPAIIRADQIADTIRFKYPGVTVIKESLLEETSNGTPTESNLESSSVRAGSRRRRRS